MDITLFSSSVQSMVVTNNLKIMVLQYIARVKTKEMVTLNGFRLTNHIQDAEAAEANGK